MDIGPNTITETEIKDNSISTPKLRANAVRAHNIAANEILGMHVRGRQFTGEHMQLGTLDVSHFRSGLGSGNLVPNAGLIPAWSNDKGQQADGWAAQGETASAGIAVSPDSSKKPPNSEYLAVAFPPYSGSSEITVYSESFPVSAGTWYEFHALGACSGGSAEVKLAFFDARGSLVQPAQTKGTAFLSNGGGRASSRLSTWQQAFALARSPGDAVSARFGLVARPASTSAAAEMYLTRPYVGAATGALQETPTPWSPSGLGTQIHGGIIKTRTIHASAVAVERLSALSANLGSVTAGDISSSTVRGGYYQNFDWPARGHGGFCLNGRGLRLGNQNDGRFVEITSDGDFRAPGFRIERGTMSIDHLRVIRSANIREKEISRFFRAATTWAGGTARVSFTLTDTCTALVSFGAASGQNVGYNNVTGNQARATLPLKVNGQVAAEAPWVTSTYTISQGSSNRAEVIGYSSSAALSRTVTASPGPYTVEVTGPNAFLEILAVFQ